MIGQHVARHRAQQQEQQRLRDARTRETFAYFRAQQKLRITKWLTRLELRQQGLTKRGTPYVHWSGGSGGSAAPWDNSEDYQRPQDMHILLRGNCKGRF